MYGTDCAGIGISALVAHHAHRHHWQQDSKRLPDFRVHAGALDFVYNNVVAFAKDYQPFGRNFAENAHREPWAGEGLPLQNFLWHSQIATDLADFIFE